MIELHPNILLSTLSNIKEEINKRITRINEQLEDQKDHPLQANPYILGLKTRKGAFEDTLAIIEVEINTLKIMLKTTNNGETK